MVTRYHMYEENPIDGETSRHDLDWRKEFLSFYKHLQHDDECKHDGVIKPVTTRCDKCKRPKPHCACPKPEPEPNFCDCRVDSCCLRTYMDENHEPRAGFIKSAIVKDPINRRMYVYDGDGIPTEFITDFAGVEFANEPGQGERVAASQKWVTNLSENLLELNAELAERQDLLEEKVDSLDIDHLVKDVLVDGESVVEDRVAKINIADKVTEIAGEVVPALVEPIVDEKIDEAIADKADKSELENLATKDELDQKADKSEIPTKTSQLENDSGFITLADVPETDLSNYYNKQEVDDLVNAITTGEFVKVDELPETGEPKNIYLVPSEDGYDEYIYVDGAWEKIGDTNVDLSNYYTKEQVDNLLAEKQDNLTASDGVKIENGVIKLDPDTALEALGYGKVQLSKTDENGETITIEVIGKVIE